MTPPSYAFDALEWRDACAQHEAALRRYSAAPRRSPEADAAWREVQP